MCEKPSDCLKILANQDGVYWGRFKRFLFSCCMSKESCWHFERAPEPSDIYWENLQISTFARLFAGLISMALTVVQILFCVGIIAGIKQWQDSEQSRIREIYRSGGKKMSLYDTAKLNGISALSAGFIFVINFLLKFSMRALSRREMHETQTKTNVSVALKLTIARFFNSALVLVIVNGKAEDWYNNGNLVWDATILLVLLAF